MRFSADKIGAVLLGSALAISGCSTKGRDSIGSRAAQVRTRSAGPPALWEPVDRSFTGCAGG